MDKIQICIADDHPMVLQGLVHALSSKPNLHILDTYINGNSLLVGLQRQLPDVLILDVLFPDYTAEELLPMLTAQHPTLRVLALTSIDNIARVRNLIRLGCLGYLLKNAHESTINQAIETVYRGGAFVTPELKAQLSQEQMEAKKEMPAQGDVLTRREKEILQLIIKAHTSREIAKLLFISLHTVENHRKHLFQKLDVKNATGLVQKAVVLGLIDS